MTQTSFTERLAHLKRMHQEWTAQFHALDGPDLEVARAFAEALGDLEILIRATSSDPATGDKSALMPRDGILRIVEPHNAARRQDHQAVAGTAVKVIWAF